MLNNEIENKLRDKNTKPTSMRILMYDFLATQVIALSLSEIEAHFYPADRITLYRTLKTFEEKGIVHSIQENNTSKYMLCNDDCNEVTHKDRHLHFYCKLCKQTTCRADIVFSLPNNNSIRIDEVRLFAKGICQDCMDQTMQ